MLWLFFVGQRMRERLGPRRSKALKVHLEDLARAPVARYVEVQRQRGRLAAIDKVDVDLEQLVERPFLCDRHRCIQWTPHQRKADARPLIDNSCCARYDVPVTDLDRKKLQEILPQVQRRLPPGHPLRDEDASPPFRFDEEYACVLDDISGRCQFVLYENGLTTCAIHKTCLEEGLDVWEYKQLGCSLWPLALVEGDGRGQTPLLLTVYARATSGLFVARADEANDEGHFACLVDQDDSYEPLYKSMEGILRYALGDGFFRKLERVASAHLGRNG